jgi:hypothetical protein
MTIAGAIQVDDGVELRLGGEVPLRIAPSAKIPAAMELQLAGERYVAPLGPARLGVGTWHLELAGDEWTELVTNDDPPAFVGSMGLASRVTLLIGDAIAEARGGATVLRIVG